MITPKQMQDAVNWFESIGDMRGMVVVSECPESWKKTNADFWEWIADRYSKEIKEWSNKNKTSI